MWMSFCLGAVEGIRTPMVAHTDLNRARLPIPPRPHILYECSVLISGTFIIIHHVSTKSNIFF